VFRVIAAAFSVTLVTATEADATVTAQVAVLAPSDVVTVMVAEPAATADTRPVVETVATALLLELQLTAGLVALAGVTVAVRVCEPPTSKVVEVGLTLTLETATAALATVTMQVAEWLPSTVTTLMAAVPTVTPVTTPVALTVATLELPENQTTAWFVALEGMIVGVSVRLLPAFTVAVPGRVTPVTETGALTVTEQLA